MYKRLWALILAARLGRWGTDSPGSLAAAVEVTGKQGELGEVGPVRTRGEEGTPGWLRCQAQLLAMGCMCRAGAGSCQQGVC